ncbi:MAG: RDD family protein [Thermomicrobiales bacterium]|nr:RDD family protein [Thermomicrobiales bacterium]
MGSKSYAGFWQRAAAAVIDGIIVWVGLAALVGTLDDLGFFLGLVGVWLYFSLQESSSYQATLGKRALGIIVADQFGVPLTFGRATGRFFAKYLSGMFFGIGYLIAAFTARKQALHDMIASTIVLRR